MYFVQHKKYLMLYTPTEISAS